MRLDELLVQLDKITVNSKSDSGQYEALKQVADELGKKTEAIDNIVEN